MTAQTEPNQLLTWKAWAVPGALTLVSLIYGGWAILAKSVLSHHAVAPLVLATYRCLGGGIVMFLAQLVLSRGSCTGITEGRRVSRSQVARLAALGVLLACNIGGNILALQALPAVTVSVFQPLLPVIAGVMSALLGIEAFSALKLCGVVCAVAGAVVVVVFGARGGHTSGLEAANYARGVPCLCINVWGGALYIVFQREALRAFPPVFTAGVASAEAAAILAVGALVAVGGDANAWSLGGDRSAWLAILYAIFLTSALNYSILAWANRESTPTTVTSFLTLQPIFAALLSWIILGVILTAGQAVGGAAIIIGLLFFLRAQLGAESSELLAASTPLKQEKP